MFSSESPTRGCAAKTSTIGNAVISFSVNADAMRVALLNDEIEAMPHLFQPCNRIYSIVVAQAFHLENVGKPLVMHARGIDGIFQFHLEDEMVDDHAKHRVDNGSSARAAGDEDNIPIFGDDCGRH